MDLHVATLSLHLILFPASLRASQNFNPVHSEMLFSQLFFCGPLLLPPCTIPCKIVFASLADLATWPAILFLQDVQVCSRFSEMQDMHFVKTGILGFKAKWWHDSGLKVYMGYSTVQLKSSRGKPVAIELHYTVDQQNHSDLL